MTRFYDVNHGKVLQFERLLVDEANMTAEELEAVLCDPKLAHVMLSALREQLNPPPAAATQYSYTPTGELVSRIMARSQLRDWGFTTKQADTLGAQLEGLNHAGPLSPVSVRIWRGRGLAYNWAESMAWLEDEVKAQGLEYCKYFNGVPTFYEGSEIKGKPSLTAIGLDLTPWNRQDGVVPSEEWPKLKSWPSLEVPDLICLNPQIMHIMDGENFPHLMSPGLAIDSVRVPRFTRDAGRFYVRHHWADDAWCSYAIVRPREL